MQHSLSTDPRINHKWEVINRGFVGSTSEDWLPHWSKKPARFAWFVSNTLWKDTFESEKGISDAEVVLVVVGSQDHRSARRLLRGNVQVTVKNLKTIIVELLERGKIVSAAYLLPEKDKKNSMVEERNRLLEELFKSLKEDPKYEKRFIEGPKLHYAMYSRAGRVDGFHLNSEGYKRVAQSWYQKISNEFVKVQWNSWKQTLLEGEIEKK